MTRRGERTIVLKFPADEYGKLDEAARKDDRTAWQQARHLIRRGLGIVEPEPETETVDVA